MVRQRRRRPAKRAAGSTTSLCRPRAACLIIIRATVHCRCAHIRPTWHENLAKGCEWTDTCQLLSKRFYIYTSGARARARARARTRDRVRALSLSLSPLLLVIMLIILELLLLLLLLLSLARFHMYFGLVPIIKVGISMFRQH